MKTFHIVGNDDKTLQFFKEMELPIVCAQEADILVFSGQTEISPTLYNEKRTYTKVEVPLSKTDIYETNMYYRFLDKEKIGIGRGAQLLFVMNGGRLWQQVNSHSSLQHKIYTDKKEQLVITSQHHTMMRNDTNKKNPFEILATSYIATHIKSEEMSQNIPRVNQTVLHNKELEVVWFPKTSTLCFQPLPQECLDKIPSDAAYTTCYYFFDLIEQKFNLKEDQKCVG